jgi:hypothetical protein
MANTVHEVVPGVWLLLFPVPEDMIGAKCEHLVPPLIEASKAGRLVVLAQPSPQQRSVDMSMPTFWLNAFTRRGVRVSAIGVVSHSSAVKVAVKGFHLAMKTVGAPIEAQIFETSEAAIAWAKTVVEPRQTVPPAKTG